MSKTISRAIFPSRISKMWTSRISTLLPTGKCQYLFGHLKSNRAVVHHTILGSDALEWLKGHIAHGRPELPIITLDRLLPRERSVKTVRCRCLPNDIVGECRKCGLHVVQRLTVKMVHNGRQILSYSFFVHILLSLSWHNGQLLSNAPINTHAKHALQRIG